MSYTPVSSARWGRSSYGMFQITKTGGVELGSTGSCCLPQGAVQMEQVPFHPEQVGCYELCL